MESNVGVKWHIEIDEGVPEEGDDVTTHGEEEQGEAE